ncbi:glycosyltransferase [candidate division KSB1 bacterium]|nr:glycosyltransferase [candidate division KSB1 bacterium]
MELSIIIINFNVKEFLEQALVSIQKATEHIETEIFVVDNASQDGSVALVREKFPEVNLVVNTQNVGFAAANNQALKLVRGRFIALVNNDTIVQEDTFTHLLRFLKNHPEAGMVGCKILNPDGTLQLACRRSAPSPWVAFTKAVGLSRLFPHSRLFGRYNLTYLDPDETYEVEAISGSFMIVKRESFEAVGYLDETFFMYGEDLDWCHRIRQAGWKIYYVHDTSIIHFKGESSKTSGFDHIRIFYQAMRLYVRKHYNSRFFQLFLMLGIFLRAVPSFLGKFFNALIVPVVDLMLLNLSLIVALYIRFGGLHHLKAYIIVTVLYSSIWLGCLFFALCYSKFIYSASRAVLAVIAGLIINTSFTFFFNQIAYSRAVVLISGLLNILLLGGWRFVAHFFPKGGLVRYKGLLGRTMLGRRTIVVGTSKASCTVANRLQNRLDGGFEVRGLVSFNSEDLGKHLAGTEVLGTINNLAAIIKQQKIKEVIFPTDRISYDKMMEVMYQARGYGVNFRIVPGDLEVMVGKPNIDFIGDVPLLDIDYKLNQPIAFIAKRLLDLVLSGFILLATSPVLLTLRYFKRMPIVKIPLHGEGGKPTTCLEFQTDAKRWYTLLPAFYSVLKGELSLVGAEMLPLHSVPHAAKLPIKPGLTGLIQLAKPSPTDKKEKERYYLFYIKNYSLLLDVEILFKTVFKL